MNILDSISSTESKFKGNIYLIMYKGAAKGTWKMRLVDHTWGDKLCRWQQHNLVLSKTLKKQVLSAPVTKEIWSSWSSHRHRAVIPQANSREVISLPTSADKTMPLFLFMVWCFFAFWRLNEIQRLHQSLKKGRDVFGWRDRKKHFS